MWETFLSRSGLKRDDNWARFVAQWLAISFVLHLIASVRSAGFYHSDEHFKVLELTSSRFGRTPASDLPMEVHLQTVSWLLPAIYSLMGSLWNAIGVTNPFDWALSYRVFAAMVGWVSVAGLALCCYQWFQDKKWRSWAVFLLSLTWYLPALHARHSDQNLGGSLFLIGLTFMLLTSRPGTLSVATAVISGVFFGFASLLQYQITAMSVGVVAWLLIMARVSALEAAPLGLGFLGAAAIGALVDRWGYGTWTFSLFNSFAALFHPATVSAPVTHWYDLARETLVNTWPVLGVLAAMSFITAWVRFPRHVLTWATLPFLVFQCIAGPRELRFLDPIALCGPILILMSIHPVAYKRLNWVPDWEKFLKRKWAALTLQFVVGLNLIALVMTSTTPAWMPIQFYSHLYKYRPYGFELYYLGDSPYTLTGSQVYFYRPPSIALRQINQYQELIVRLKEEERPAWLFNRNFELPEEAGELRQWCKADYTMLPGWVEKLNYGKILSKVSDWTIFRCQGPDKMKSSLETTMTGI